MVEVCLAIKSIFHYFCTLFPKYCVDRVFTHSFICLRFIIHGPYFLEILLNHGLGHKSLKRSR